MPSSYPSNGSVKTKRPSLAATTRLSNLVSWSKNGFIAYADSTSNGPNLHLTYLENVDGQSWQLAQSQGIEIRPDSGPIPDLSLVLWSNLSTDLAVADVHGNFYILLAGVGLLEKHDTKPLNVSVSLNGSNGSVNGSNEVSNGASNGSSNGNGIVKNSPSYELTSYNHMEMIYRDVVDDKSTGSVSTALSIVAFKWLDIEKPQIINKPAQASKTSESSYSYSVGQFQPHGVTHPISTKQAGFALRKNGELVMFYQGEHKVEYHKLSVSLPSDDSLSLSLASIGVGNDKKVIVCAFDAISQKIITFTVAVDWGFLVESARKQKVEPHHHTPKELQKSPKLIITKVQEMVPLARVQNDGHSEHSIKIKLEQKPKLEHEVNEIKMEDSEENSDFPEMTATELCSIDVISASGEASSKPDILISYTGRSKSTYTTIHRYHLCPESDLVSDAFADLGMRLGVKQATQDPSQILVLQDELVREGELSSMTTGVASTFLLMQFTSGRVDALDRSKMKVVNNKKKNSAVPLEISSIFDVGFEFPPVEGTDIVMAVSPNMTSFVYFAAGTEPRIEVVRKERYLGVTKSELSLSAVGFAFRHAYACYTNTCADDLIILIQSEIARVNKVLKLNKSSESSKISTQNLDSASEFSSQFSADLDFSTQQFLSSQNQSQSKQPQQTIPDFIQLILVESHRAINFQLDAFNKESVDKLLSNPPLQKLLSLQLILGEIQTGYSNPGVGSGAGISDISWVVLNLRSSSFGVMFSLSSIYRQISKKKPNEDSLQDSITRGECIVSLIGNINWLIDIMVYLNQELLQLAMAKKHPKATKLNVRNSLVLPLILSKVPRLFLMYALCSISKTHEILKKLHKDLLESNKLLTPMKESLSRCFTIVNNSPLSLGLFENYLKESDALISREFSVLSKERNILQLEQKLVCQGELDDAMVRIADILIERHSVSISRDTKMSELYFYDVDWLNVGINRRKIGRSGSSEIIHRGAPQTVIPRLPYSRDECIDALRKIVIHMCGNRKLRRCTRCRSVSLVTDMLVFDAPNTIGLWTMVFQRTCICGNPWVNCDK